MSRAALIITYHAIEAGPAPLCIAPWLFESHLDTLSNAGARCMTVSRLAAAFKADALPERAVAITFDDGFASVAEFAADALANRGLSATVFCVAGHLGASNDWQSQPAGTYRAALMGTAQIHELASAGFEIGSHGIEHAPLHDVKAEVLEKEVLTSQQTLEQIVGRPVSAFAYPYGEPPSETGRALIERRYEVAVSGGLARVDAQSDLYLLPRVDAHYLRRPRILRELLAGHLDRYLAIRRIGALARRAVRRDYVEAA